MKRIKALVLLVTFLTSFGATPLFADSASSKNQTLTEFLKTTDEISTHYEYPSMIASTNTKGYCLPAHTMIPIRCDETITTKNIVNGSEVNFSVCGNIKDANGHTIIKSGTPVTANISFRKEGMIGRSGEITVTDFHTTAIDGTYVPLSASVNASPDDKMCTSIVLSLLICPLFLLMKGDEAKVPAGTSKSAYTVTDIYVKPSAL